jgi:hypothetical protein
MYPDLALYVGGEWKNGGSRKGEDVINPATEKPLARLPHASTADLDEALAAATKGFEVWRATPAYDRAKLLRKAANLVRERADAIARIMTQEQGKVIAEARLEVLVTADIIEWYAEEGRRAYGRIVPGRQKGVRQLVTQEPVGICIASGHRMLRRMRRGPVGGTARNSAGSRPDHHADAGKLRRTGVAALSMSSAIGVPTRVRRAVGCRRTRRSEARKSFTGRSRSAHPRAGSPGRSASPWSLAAFRRW